MAIYILILCLHDYWDLTWYVSNVLQCFKQKHKWKKNKEPETCFKVNLFEDFIKHLYQCHWYEYHGHIIQHKDIEELKALKSIIKKSADKVLGNRSKQNKNNYNYGMRI
jgi:hypothetical protein